MAFFTSHFTSVSCTGVQQQPQSESDLIRLHAEATPGSTNGPSEEPVEDYTSKDTVHIFGPFHLTSIFKKEILKVSCCSLSQSASLKPLNALDDPQP